MFHIWAEDEGDVFKVECVRNASQAGERLKFWKCHYGNAWFGGSRKP